MNNSYYAINQSLLNNTLTLLKKDASEMQNILNIPEQIITTANLIEIFQEITIQVINYLPNVHL